MDFRSLGSRRLVTQAGRLVMLATAALTLTVGGTGLVAAQDATPAAAVCDAPALPPGTPSPMEEQVPPAGPPEGTPEEHDMAAMGTPEAIEEAEEGAEIAEEASPQAPDPGTPADEATAAEAIAAAENLIACNNAGNIEGLVALMTENFLLSEFGAPTPYDAMAFLETLPITVESLGDAQTHDDGRLSVDIVYTGLMSPYNYVHQRWYFVDDEDYHKIDQWDYLPIETADVTVDAEMLDYAFNLSQDTFTAGQTVAFNVTNTGEYPHELVVLRLPEGITVEQVLEDPSLESQVEFYGFAFGLPGETSYLGLTGLEAGTYALVCFVDEPEGIPHVARGMVSQFTVE